ICAPKKFKFLIGGIIKTFPSIDVATKNIEIFDRRISPNISSNQFGHQKYSNIRPSPPIDFYKKYSNSCSKDFSKHFLQSICAIF
ncbi:MAG: hypothetical protein VXX80_10985, partial [Bacteroidota bacterium]|nr:hypothetical protein [Bacteroidota bacterium]